MDDREFHQLLQELGLSWAGYRKVRKGVKKRVSRHIQRLGCRNMTAYLRALHRNDTIRRECECLMTVSISRFFRDRNLWTALEIDVLPPLINRKMRRFKVWSAGCASGEEVYTFKIIWDRLQDNLAHLPELEITATDMNPDYLDRARQGIYTSGSLKEVEGELRSAYFEARRGGTLFAVKSLLKREIRWTVHNLLSEPPGNAFHVIFLRNNLLTYYQDHLKIPAFRKIINTLTPYGLLIIGSHEKLPFPLPKMVRLAQDPHIFQNRG